MSDEESFVILGSSPMSSLEQDGVDINKPSGSSILESDTPGSAFSSLRKSQLNDLKDACETSAQTEVTIMEKTAPSSQIEPHLREMGKVNSTITIKPTQAELSTLSDKLSSIQLQVKPDMAEPKTMKQPIKAIESTNIKEATADKELWSRKTQVRKDINALALNLEDCAVKYPLDNKKQEKEDLSVAQKTSSSSNPTSLKEKSETSCSNKSTPHLPTNNSLASSFIMGEVNAEVLKTSVYSQFPSICMHSSAEDVIKLQNMITENMQLRATLEKVNNTMRFFHSSSLQWQEKMNNIEMKYKQELSVCQKEIEMLRKENEVLQTNWKTQIEALEIARQKDREETIKEISEKRSLLENMRAQIVKLNQQQMASFEFVAPIHNDNKNDQYYITRDEHELKVKELEKQLTELLASTLDLKDLEKQYIDELNCLKVNLTSAEELIKHDRATIVQLQAQDQERLGKIKQLETTVENLRIVNGEQNERISLLEQQNEVYRKDFEMEQEGRNTAVKEKQQMLQDLRNLQKRNQELIQDHQKLVDSYEKRLNSSIKSGMNQSCFVSAASAAQTNFNNPQRPIRVGSNLLSFSSESEPVPPTACVHCCPICNKAFRSLNILQSHVNDCIDKN